MIFNPTLPPSAAMVEREIAGQRTATPVHTIVEEEQTEPTPLDRLEAQVLWTALLTDTLMEGGAD